MATFDIVRWDAVLVGNESNPQPMIYIKPNPEFIKFCEENQYTVFVQIKNTMSEYDTNNLIQTYVYGAGQVPNCRQNFFANTGEYVMILPIAWLGYPSNTGQAIISGLNGKYPYLELTVPPFTAPTPLERLPPKEFPIPPVSYECFNGDNEINKNKSCSFNSAQLFTVGGLGIVLIGILIGIDKKF